MTWQPVEENLRRAMRMFSRAAESGEAHDMPGVTLVSSGVDYPVFNSAMLSDPVTGRNDLDRRLALAGVHFSMRGIGWSFWLCKEQLQDASTRRWAEEIFAGRGLRRLTENPGMAAESLTPPPRSLAALDCRRVADIETRAAFCHITSIAFHLPFSVSQAVYGSARFWEGDYRGWVGYREGRPVTAAATLAWGGAIGLYSLATLPDERRRGYAEAMARHALECAAAESGRSRLILQSTPVGHSLYKRMGYRSVASFAVWVSG
jgi:GNAT superfamily N-acetyltransferase